ncbi:DUF6711 domain-containing protein [Hathewaya histolytica]|uniref:Lj965 prophage protein n=1 Tax=Hathewaya histolytica TaxID=1498 RepID=A0A4U9RD70_HATHI|nr:DUF6711 family protein [Hathewaya histolytica]VTQ89692.1 Lj965 prophage protein [Hathewaya histolytica]
MLKINGLTIVAPKSFKVSINDLDGETTRNARGDLIRDRIAVKRKLECEWGPLKDNEISNLLKVVTSVYFSVEYPDPVEGKRLSKTFYVGDRSAPMYFVKDGVPLWQGLSMNFIEK